jgi:two-component system response regulator HydG
MEDLNMSVLTIDDEVGLADSIQRILNSEGYSAFMETDGNAAVNFCKANLPDIVLIDVSLGNKSINGIEVLKKIKELKPDTVCVMVTRITDKSTVEKAKEFGAFRYVLKPLTSDDIIYIVNEAAQVVKQRRSGNG